LAQKSPESELSSEDYAFRVGTKEQLFSDSVPAPERGWQKGNYVLSTYLLVSDEELPFGPSQTIPVGMLDWEETNIDLTPSEVQECGYDVVTTVAPGIGDGYRLEATGQITPARVTFYRDLLQNRRLKDPPPARPQGITPLDSPRLRMFGVVKNDAPFAALLYRRGRQGWTTYTGRTRVLLSIESAPFRLSINSVTHTRPHPQRGLLPISASDSKYWLPDCGAFHVTILVGRFDFPVELGDSQRKHLLEKFD
jgi:hypothetical protein